MAGGSAITPFAGLSVPLGRAHSATTPITSTAAAPRISGTGAVRNERDNMQRHWELTVLFVVAALLLQPGQPTVAAGPLLPGGVRPNDQSKSKLVQNPAFIARKIAWTERVSRTAPRDPVLNSSVTGLVIEPEGGPDLDDATPTRNSYSDAHYWNFCTAGAVAATLFYWVGTNVTSWPAQNFTEPAYVGPAFQVTTYWASSDTDGNAPNYSTVGRAYLMYIAEQVQPPSYPTPGEVTFSGWSATGTLNDMRDALNWEASLHAANWSTFFYVVRTASALTQANLHDAVAADVFSATVPVIAITQTSALPGWNNPNVIHAIAIIGYDDVANTYTYIDTCGARCGSGVNGGIHTVNQATLFNGIQAAAASGSGIVW